MAQAFVLLPIPFSRVGAFDLRRATGDPRWDAGVWREFQDLRIGADPVVVPYL